MCTAASMRLWLSGFRTGRSCDMSKPKTISEAQHTFLPSLATHTSCTTRLPGNSSMMFTKAMQTSSASAGMASTMLPRATQQCRTMSSSSEKFFTTPTTLLSNSRNKISSLKMRRGACLKRSTHCLTKVCALISGSQSTSMGVTSRKQTSTSIGSVTHSFSISWRTSCTCARAKAEAPEKAPPMLSGTRRRYSKPSACSEESASSSYTSRWGSASCSGSVSEGTGVEARPPSAARSATGSGAGSSSDAPTSTSTSTAPAPAAAGASAAPTARCLWRRFARLRRKPHFLPCVKR
mmetsp:Transcript_31493/g.104374  ORF Transcript_31493/g.104374 Transcript_31493/m.104374 type:complete len:293 (+) Transcript_31493:1079-1957(+)